MKYALLAFAGVLCASLAVRSSLPETKLSPDMVRYKAATAGGLIVTDDAMHGFYVSRGEPTTAPKWLSRARLEEWNDIVWVGVDEPSMVLPPSPRINYWRGLVVVGDQDLFAELKDQF